MVFFAFICDYLTDEWDVEVCMEGGVSDIPWCISDNP
jgi:hypothetical protein